MRRDDFLDAEARPTTAFLLVKSLADCRQHADEIIFCQRARNQLLKALPTGKKKKSSVEQAVRDLVDDVVESEGVVDIFTAAGLPRADISVLDEQFLQTFKDKPQQNLRLEQLLADEIRRRQHRNLVQAKSFRELLEETLQRYHNRLGQILSSNGMRVSDHVGFLPRASAMRLRAIKGALGKGRSL
jgi:type I restriction enzyme R subunit